MGGLRKLGEGTADQQTSIQTYKVKNSRDVLADISGYKNTVGRDKWHTKLTSENLVMKRIRALANGRKL